MTFCWLPPRSEPIGDSVEAVFTLRRSNQWWVSSNSSLRLSRKPVDLVRGMLTAGLAVVVVSGATNIAVLVAFAAALGCAETLLDTASLALVPSIVGTDPERLTRANARLESATIVANGFAGPAAGAALFAIAAALPMAIDPASLFASALVLRGVSVSGRSSARPASSGLRCEIGAGVRWLAGQPLLLMLAVVVGVMNLALAVTGLLVLLV